MTADPPYLPDLRGEARDAAIRELQCECCNQPADPELSVVAPRNSFFAEDRIRCSRCGLEEMSQENRDFHD